MLNKIRALLKKVSQQPSFDLSRFNDKVALDTQWNPLKGGGTNFRTHKLVSVNYNRIEFKATLGAKVFSFIFIGVGLAVPIWIGIDSVQKTGQFFQSDFLFTLLFGLIFLVAGSLLFYSFAKPVIFDKTKGMYWKGWKAPAGYLAQTDNKNSSRISNIHAIQIISELVRSKNRSYFSYELNLVLDDGSRMNVIDHGNAGKLREDAKTLSEFLGVPVWDAA